MAKQEAPPTSVATLPSYAEVIAYLTKKKRKKHLLLGNGFSMAYDKEIFSYNALSKFIETTGDDLVNKLFEKLKTKNFETVMQQLDDFCTIAGVFSTDITLLPRIQEASEKLKHSLIDAVKSLHPDQVFAVPAEQSSKCMAFLQEYLQNNGLVFSTNYDLLLYWVLMRNGADNAVDGFGRDLESDLDAGSYIAPEDRKWSELRWGKHKEAMSVFYLHGTLPFFDTGVHVIKVEYETGQYLLENVKHRIEEKQYPIFVTAGSGEEKLVHIAHNKYLTHCYDTFCTIQGSLVVFGFGFGESDSHIVDAINRAAKRRPGENLLSVYVGVQSDESLNRLMKLREQIKCNKVHFYNARTVEIWGALNA
ncbi:MAG: DUF4917 family protein [Bacteroidota bacterium]|nr:DUF4917 family protein [Bacteroidota bacterium]